MPSLLFADDEPTIRQTLPAILKMHGFETTAVATVTEALKEITSRRFDVLISDLNIGEQGDGFTVVSAMRRVQPECLTFILTGFPALETALKAIRAQVDDYIVKPASIPSLIAAIEGKLKDPRKHEIAVCKRLSTVLRENVQNIADYTLANFKAEPKLVALPLSDQERTDHIPFLIKGLATMLESERPEQIVPETMRAANLRGQLRFRQGYSVDMLVTEARMLVRAVNDTIQENLLSVDLSQLMIDLKWLNENLALQLEETIRAYVQAETNVAA
jgi:ActR/RegA family two-component response regulator